MMRASLVLKVADMFLCTLTVLLLVQEQRDREITRVHGDELRELQRKFDILEKNAAIEARLSSPRVLPAIGDAAAGDFPTTRP